MQIYLKVKMQYAAGLNRVDIRHVGDLNVPMFHVFSLKSWSILSLNGCIAFFSCSFMIGCYKYRMKTALFPAVPAVT